MTPNHPSLGLNRQSIWLLGVLGVGMIAMTIIGLQVPLTSRTYIGSLVVFRIVGVALTVIFMLEHEETWRWPTFALLGAELIFTTGRVVSLIQSIDALITQIVWVTAYVPLILGIWGISKSWLKSGAGVIVQDTLLVFLTCMVISADFIGVKSWEVILSSEESGVERVVQLINSSFHVLDLVLLGLLCRAAISAMKFDARAICLLVGVTALMVGDVIWQLPDVNTINTMPARFSFALYQISFISFMLSLHLPARKPSDEEAVPRSIARKAYIEGLVLLGCLIIPALASLVLSVVGEHHNWPLAILGSAGLSILATARLGRIFRESISKMEAFYTQSRHDPLTGCLNRTGWATTLEYIKETEKPYCIMLIDLDHFKKFNDTKGHVAGDELLQDAVIAWKQALPERAELARIGGEEFGVVVPYCNISEGDTLAHKLIAVIPRNQTASIGIAEGHAGIDPHDLPERVDQALYRAKRNGRARVEIATLTEPGCSLKQSADVVQGMAAPQQVPVQQDKAG